MISYIIVSNNPEILENNIVRSLQLREGDETVIIRDAQGIAEAYNRGARQAKNAIKCFIHHDLIVLNPDKLREELIRHATPAAGIVGVIGTTNADAVPWWDKGDIGSVLDNGKLIKFSEKGGPCALLDGLLLATRQPVAFDEELPGFHLYDHDICRQMLSRGLPNFCLDHGCSLVLHNTSRTNDSAREWEQNAILYCRKWNIQTKPKSMIEHVQMNMLAGACPGNDLRMAERKLPSEFMLEIRNLDAFYAQNTGKLILSLEQGPEALFRQFASRAGYDVPEIERRSETHWARLIRRAVAKPSTQKTSIVMLSYGKGKFTANAIDSIRRHTPSPFELIVVDNASPDPETPAILQELKNKGHIDQLVLNKNNAGVPAGWNQGLALASGEFLAVLNNDVLVTPGWLEALIHCVESEPRAGIAGSRTNSITGPQLVFQAPNNQQLEFLLPFAEKWNQWHRSGWWKTYRIRGFAFLMRKEVWRAVGPFDEAFGQGNFEDDDICLRMLKLGHDLFIVDDSYIHHFGSLSFGDAQTAYQQLLWKNQEYFIRKWRASDHDLLKKVAIHSADRHLTEYTFTLQTLTHKAPEVKMQRFGFASPPALLDLYRK